MYVTTESELADLVDRLQGCTELIIDTEFVREKTYFHRLGLVQLAANGVFAAVDPIAVPNLDPLIDLIKRRDVLKVFHAGKQDLEILYQLAGEVIQPVFDTQVAAAMIGWGAQISFAKLVKRATGKRLHKNETYSDWCRRPLSNNQIEYALDDVRFLVPVYEKVVAQLKKLNRLEWVQEELKSLTDADQFELPDPYTQFMRVKNVRTLKPRQMAVLREVAAWREMEARRRDCLAKFIIRDETLLQMARQNIETVKQLHDLRGINGKEINHHGEKLLELIQRGRAVPESECPDLPEGTSYATNRGVEELLAAYVQIRSEELKIEPHLLADRKLIHSFVACHEQEEGLEEHPLFEGWRKHLIGSDLHLILEGQQGLIINKKGRVTLINPHPRPNPS
ncbi:ribonuclease D [Nitrospina watsonii]|uniref:Ribonuclease D n=1 Tax=Nitrospina watsonii TaxID=1323948 RepID=A0ABN8W1L4_9BACT|nr:ribonuclease D [Nitrospina watsonii]CAI2718726.1 Ribonuclease D [Nitrospina watsonii]